MKNPIVFKFLLFFAAGVAIISFFGIGHMLIKGGYDTWNIVISIVVLILAILLALYIYKKVR